MKGTIVFILSNSRSGSTWLSYVLGSHRGCATLGEYYQPFYFRDHYRETGSNCTRCFAAGLQRCEKLGDLQQIEELDAYDYAFRRVEAETIVDCSKTTDWLETFLGNPSFRILALHLIRDPRGWLASLRRRAPDCDLEMTLQR
jgi:hypothetical protein